MSVSEFNLTDVRKMRRYCLSVMVSYYYIVNAFKSRMDNYWKDFCYTLDPEDFL